MFLNAFSAELYKEAGTHSDGVVEMLRNQGRRKRWLMSGARERFVRARTPGDKPLPKTASMAPLARMVATGAIAKNVGVKTPGSMMMERIREGGSPLDKPEPKPKPKAKPKTGEKPLPPGTRSYTTSKSSNVAGFRYEASTQTLHVTYKSGGTYKYKNVPPSVYRALKRNKSAGKTVHKRVKGGGYDYEKVSAPRNPFHILVGDMGAGKTTLADKVGKNYDLVLHTDTGEPGKGGWKRPSQAERTKIRADRKRVIINARQAGKSVLLEGSTTGVMKIMGDDVSVADKVYYLHVPRAERARRVKQRSLDRGSVAREDLAQLQIVEKRTRDDLKRIRSHVPVTKIRSPEQIEADLRKLTKKANDPTKETVKIHGISIALEWRRGETRKYYNHDPLKPRSKGSVDYNQKMTADYGYVKGVIDADGEELDVYVGLNRESEKVFVLEKLRRTDKSFDENKIMLGYDSMDDAKKSYLQHQGSDEMGKVVEMTVPAFKAKFMSAAAKKKFKKHGVALKQHAVGPRRFVTLKDLEPYRERARGLMEQWKREGSGIKKIGEQKTFFHGSPSKVTVLKPSSEHGDPRVKPAVFASDSKTFALAYAGRKWGDRDIEQSTRGGTRGPRMILREMRPNAFEDIYGGKKGYLYEVPSAPFKALKGRRTAREVTSSGAVKPIGVSVVRDVLAELKKTPDVEMHSYDPAAPEVRKAVRRQVGRMREWGGREGREYLKWRLAVAPPEVKKMFKEEMSKTANGDMLEYFNKHPKKRAEYLERQKAKEKRKASPEGRANRAAFRKRLACMRKTAGACKKTMTVDGLTLKFEFEKGDTRFKGAPHERTMLDCYGYMPGTYGKGADGEAIDFYSHPGLKKGETLGPVYKVRQLKKGSGEFDEDKYMIGYDSAADAKKAFLRNMPGWAFGSMTSMSIEAFRKLVGQDKKPATMEKAAISARLLRRVLRRFKLNPKNVGRAERMGERALGRELSAREALDAAKTRAGKRGAKRRVKQNTKVQDALNKKLDRYKARGGRESSGTRVTPPPASLSPFSRRAVGPRAPTLSPIARRMGVTRMT